MIVGLSRLLFAAAPIAIGENDKLQRMFRAMRDSQTKISDTQVAVGFVIVLAFLVVLAMMAMMFERRQNRRSYHSAGGLFNDLCKAHRLTFKQRWLLRRLSRFQKLRVPARLFIEEERFDLVNVPTTLRPYAKEFYTIRATIYRDDPEPKSAEKDKPQAESGTQTKLKTEQAADEKNAAPASTAPPVEPSKGAAFVPGKKPTLNFEDADTFVNPTIGADWLNRTDFSHR